MSVVLTGGRRQPQVLSTLSLFANPAARHRAAAARPPPSLCVRVPEWKNGRVPDRSNHGRAEVSSRLTALSLTLSLSELNSVGSRLRLGLGVGFVPYAAGWSSGSRYGLALGLACRVLFWHLVLVYKLVSDP